MSSAANDVKKINESLTSKLKKLNIKNGNTGKENSEHAQSAAAGTGSAAAGTGNAAQAPQPKPILQQANAKKKEKQRIKLSESTIDREINKENEEVKRKADVLYSMIRNHPDFDFYKEVDKFLGDVQMLSARALTPVQVTKYAGMRSHFTSKREAIKSEVQRFCGKLVEQGGPLHVNNGGELRKKVLGIVSKIHNEIPKNFWEKTPAKKPVQRKFNQ